MLTLSEIIHLKENLLLGQMTLESATELYWNNYEKGKRSWHTKDWKERRNKIIKDSCEICDGTEILTLQHLSRPKKLKEYTLIFRHTHNRISYCKQLNINN